MRRKEGFAVWLTGLPASGKSTLARELARMLEDEDVDAEILDSDELRQVLTPEPQFSEEERDWFYDVMAHIGYLLTRNGVNVLFAATANRRRHRAQARLNTKQFMEIYVYCPIEVCMARDSKGIYEKAKAGQATTVPGIQVAYEPPESGAVTVDTSVDSPEECARQVMEQMRRRSFVPTER